MQSRLDVLAQGAHVGHDLRGLGKDVGVNALQDDRLGAVKGGQVGVVEVARAVLAYFLYSNLVASVRVWIEKDSAGGSFGMWWVHLLPLLVAAWLLWREERPGPLLRRRPASEPGEQATALGQGDCPTRICEGR